MAENRWMEFPDKDTLSIIQKAHFMVNYYYDGISKIAYLLNILKRSLKDLGYLCDEIIEVLFSESETFSEYIMTKADLENKRKNGSLLNDEIGGTSLLELGRQGLVLINRLFRHSPTGRTRNDPSGMERLKSSIHPYIATGNTQNKAEDLAHYIQIVRIMENLRNCVISPIESFRIANLQKWEMAPDTGDSNSSNASQFGHNFELNKKILKNVSKVIGNCCEEKN
jgi:hypothetical protein